MHRERPSRPPGPRGLPLLGSLLSFRRNPTGFLLRLARDYGDVAHFRLGRQHAFQLNHPELIKSVLVTDSRNFTKTRGLERAKLVIGQGLLTSEGELHRRQRRLVQQAFQRPRIEACGPPIVECALHTSDHWVAGATVDMASEMLHLTLSVVGRTLFGSTIDAETTRIGRAMTAVFDYFNRLMLPFAGQLARLPLPSRRRFEEARDVLDGTVYQMIEGRRADARDRGDVLSMLLLARDESGAGCRMAETQARDEIMTMFLAGHETTATALTWTWYLLARHPEAERDLHEELDVVLGGRPPTVADLPHLPLTRMVLAESMRLFPPAWTLTRRALDDYRVGPYVLPAGSVIGMSQYVMHRDPRYFPDPERFDPLRWTAEEMEKRPKYSYFPFGGGPRVCIGEQFAWMEALLLLATLCQDWQARLPADYRLRVQPLITLRPAGGLPMTLERRTRRTDDDAPAARTRRHALV